MNNILPLVLSPDPRLHQVSRDVSPDEFGPALQAHMGDMIHTMRVNRGMGLAGVQVGDMRRIMIVSSGGNPVMVCNPVIIKASKMKTANAEGCLSFPGRGGNIMNRPRQVTVTYQDPLGAVQTLSLTGMDARCFQHEMDHLNGKTIL